MTSSSIAVPAMEQPRCHGVVKSFGLTKGYGFIESQQVQGDIIFGRAQLPPELKEPFYTGFFQLKGRQVTFNVQFKDGKQQASGIQIIATDGDPLVGLVKSYNASKGFGFLGSSSLEGRDVFFSWRDVPPQLQGSDLTGCSARFVLGQSPDGKTQAKDVVFNDAVQPSHMSLPPLLSYGPEVSYLGYMGKGIHPMSWAGGYKGPLGKGYSQPPLNVFAKGAPFGKGYDVLSAFALSGKGKGAPCDGQGLQGIVKTLNAAKGYGFITCQLCPSDIYFKAEGGTFTENTEVAFFLKIMRPDGKLQARGVTAALVDGQMCAGTVKSYNPKNGFGFIAVPNQPADVHFKKDVVPPDLQEGNLEGQQVTVVVKVHHGKPQAQTAQFLSNRGL